VIALWIAALAVIVPFAPSLSSVSSSNEASFLPSSSESVKAQKLADRVFPKSAGATAVFVVKRTDGARLTAADEQKTAALAQKLQQARIPSVSSVATSQAQLAPNGNVQLVQVGFNGPAQSKPVENAIKPLRSQALRLLQGSGLQAGLTGNAAINEDTSNAYTSAGKIVGAVTVLLIIVLLGLIFRSPVAAFLPILAVGLVYELSSSLIATLAKKIGFTVDQSLTSLLIVVLFGIGTDYLLFLLFRYRERMRAGDQSRQAVAESVHRVGETIASSGLVVMAAMAALLLAHLGSFRTMAPTLIIAIAVMLLAALTLIPAMLTLIGPRVFWPSKRWQHATGNRTFARLGGLIGRRPALTAVVSGAVLVALAASALTIKLSYDTIGGLPSNTRAAKAYTQLKSAFPPGAVNPTQVYLSSNQKLQPARLDAVRSNLANVRDVGSVSPATLNPSGTAARIDVSLTINPTSTTGINIVSGPLRQAARAAAAPGDQVLVGGTTMTAADTRTATNHDYKTILPVAAILILLILALVLRSAFAPWLLLAGVGGGFAATLGASVLAFQKISGDNGITAMLPMIVYLFVVAVGTDYNILLTKRLREEVVDGGASPRDAAARAVEHAGPTAAAAGLILAGTFGSLMLAGVSLLSQTGFAVAAGILIVSIVMATVLIPSLAALIGNRLWWPGHKPANNEATDQTRPAAPRLRPTTEVAAVPER
jgi:putative drug exporter of the RND superfamily